MSVQDKADAMDVIFPDPVSMEDIHNMKRRNLTEEEKSKPYSKYYHKKLAEIPSSDLDIVNVGPIDPSKALTIDRRSDMMKSGYLDMETGYTELPDGRAVAATLVKMPGVTPEMLDWWFNWHPLEGLRYAIWCPVAHTDISAKDPARHLDSSGIPLKERNYGCTHYPVEGFDLDSAMTIGIEFMSPQDFGLDMTLFKAPNISNALCANVKLFDLDNMPMSVFFHAVREIDGGVEYRSRYWIGYTMIDSAPVKLELPVPVLDVARNNCLHSLTEYNNLASFLPEIYREMDGKIE